MRHQRPLLEDIERRILYSADTPAGALAAALPRPGEGAEQQVQAPPGVQLPAALELVVLDERVEDVDRLAQDIAAQAGEGRRIEFVRVAVDEDGVQAITAALAGREDVAAIHVVSHGGAGRLQLGRETLDGDALLARADEIAAWGAHLRAGADILLYGCDVASTEDGVLLVQGLAALTGADVAASDNPTGHAAQGGDWVLEQRSGAIDATTLQAAGWSGALALAPIGDQAVTNTSTGDDRPTVAVAPNGSYVVVWSRLSEVVYRRYAADGSPLSGHHRAAGR